MYSSRQSKESSNKLSQYTDLFTLEEPTDLKLLSINYNDLDYV